MRSSRFRLTHRDERALKTALTDRHDHGNPFRQDNESSLMRALRLAESRADFTRYFGLLLFDESDNRCPNNAFSAGRIASSVARASAREAFSASPASIQS